MEHWEGWRENAHGLRVVFALTALGRAPGAEAATLQLECIGVGFDARWRYTIDTDTGLIAEFGEGRRFDHRAEISSHTIRWETQRLNTVGENLTARFTIDRFSGRLEVISWRDGAHRSTLLLNCRTVAGPPRRAIE